MTYQEPKEWTLHGFPFTCTEQQFRHIRLKLAGTYEYGVWHAMDSLLRMQHACSDNLDTWRQQMDAARTTAERLAAADVALMRKLTEIIDEVVVDGMP